MANNEISSGLYLVRQYSPTKGVDHYAILDVGNRLEYDNAPWPVILQLTPMGVQAAWLHGTGAWLVLYEVDDEMSAVARIRQAMSTPCYDLFGNNCEHFARYVATGKRESSQVQTAVVVAGVIGLIALAASRRAA
jgi:hypothetical protein